MATNNQVLSIRGLEQVRWRRWYWQPLVTAALHQILQSIPDFMCLISKINK